MSRERDDAYDMVDRFLRNNLDDADYAEYSTALELLFTSEKQDQPEPVAFHKAASEEEMKVYRAIADNYHPAPQRSFVRLSEDEICEMANEAEVRVWSDEIYNFARAIEDALEEKNK